jgi:hypothetical protein
MASLSGPKEQDSFRILLSMFGDQFLTQFLEKRNVILCRDVCSLYQLGYKQNSIFVPVEKLQLSS